MKFNTRTIYLTTISCKKLNAFNKIVFDKKETELKAKALACLLGEYNKYGRQVSLKKFETLKRKFDILVEEMMTELENPSKDISSTKNINITVR